MAELRRRLRFANESRAHVGVEREIGRQDLDRDRAVQTQVGGAIDDGHAAAPDLALDQVLRADRDVDAVAQIVVHTYRAAGRLAGRVPVLRISSDTYSAVSTLSARFSASIASDVMCCGVCEPALSRIRSSLMFCSATTHVSSFAATESRRVDDVGDRAALALEMRQPPHALVAAALVERIGGALQSRDLRLERVRRRSAAHRCGRDRTARPRDTSPSRPAHPPSVRRPECASARPPACARADAALRRDRLPPGECDRRRCRPRATTSSPVDRARTAAAFRSRRSPRLRRARRCSRIAWRWSRLNIARTYVSASSATSIRSRSRGWRNTSRQS